jgi:hypothetical protein
MEQRTGPNDGGANRQREPGQREPAQLEELRQKVDELNERVVGFIRERPGTALFIALGTGFLIGRILRS